MNKLRESARCGRGGLAHGMVWFIVCLLCVPLPAQAGETIIWNGPGAPGNIGKPRLNYWGVESLFPDSPSGNSVTVNGDLPNGGHIYGGLYYAPGGNDAAGASNNRVTVTYGGIGGSVYGGIVQIDAGSGATLSTNNGITVSGGDIGGFVYGGYAESDSGAAEATGNSVSVSGGGIGGYVYGGYTWSDSGTASATGNSVIVSGGGIGGYDYGGSVHGGYAYSDSGAASVTGNSVIVSGGNIAYDVYGGYGGSYSGAAEATGNSVIVNGGGIGIFGYGDSVYGGYVYGGSAWSDSDSASATGNSVSVSGGNIAYNVYGGSAWSYSGATSATGNRVSVSGGDIGGYVYGGHAGSDSGAASAKGNSVIVSSGDIGGSVYGGYAWSYSGAAEATGNSVIVSDGGIGIFGYGDSADSGDVYGGYAYSDYAESDPGAASATGNSVIVSGGDIGGSVYGGYARSYSGAAEATGNSVIVSGGDIGGSVYGGYAGSYSGAAEATGNSVTLSGSPKFDTANSGIYGGFGDIGTLAGNIDTLTGNTLNVWNYTGSAVNRVQNFQYYNFILPASLQAFSTTFLVLGDDFGVGSKITGISIMGGGSAPKAGDALTLISASTIDGVISNDGAVVSGKKGFSLLYDFRLAQKADALTATVIGEPRLNPQTKSLSEGRLAGLAFVNQGADLIAGTGMSAARSAAQNYTGQSKYGLSPFFASQGGTSRYDTGSHVYVDGFSLMAGLAFNALTDYGKPLLGAFFEAGWGNYDSHNSFSDYAPVDGDGYAEYQGGGVIGRFDFNHTGPGNIYAEASFRAGWSKTDFSSSDLRDIVGRKADYDYGSAYYGVHAGLGYLWNIGQTSSLDLYTRYFWTHQNSDSLSLGSDPVRFKSADSHRWRGGARFAHAMTTESGLTFTPYVGAAYEYEFDGKAKADIYGYNIEKPDLKGGSGMGELGFTLKPIADSGLSFDLGVQGYTGVREGVTGSFQLRWEF